MTLESLPPWAQAAVALVLTQIIPAILAMAGIFILGSIGLRLVVRAVTLTARRSRVKPALIDLLRAATTAVGWILILAGIFQSLGLSQLALALGGSISLAALGVATAVSGNLGDIVAGIFLASDPDFGTGFTISTFGGADGKERLTGIIERIDLRKTRLRTADGKLHIIPNKMIENSSWQVENRPVSPSPAPGFPNVFRRGRHQPGQGSTDSGAPDDTD